MGISMYAAVGSWVRDMAAVPAARQVVDDVLHVTRRSGCPGGVVVTAEEVWPDLALLPVERAIAGKGSAPCAQLQRLMEHDGRHQTEYVKTLRVYLEEFGSVSKTAQRLVLHSNTLRHRLQRIGQLSGLDLSDQAQRLAVMVQLRVFAPDLPPGRDCRLGRTGMHLTRIS
jgi:sugar diacid utilization regulator